MKPAPAIHHYFVDEAGDLTFFDKHGRDIVGNDGVSTHFMVGVAQVPDPAAAEVALRVRQRLLRDPYFRGVPSMQVDAKKTAQLFHAKDDAPEVRRDVFSLLPTLGAKVQVAIRRKSDLVSVARFLHGRGEKLSANDVYDDLVKRLFRNLLHKAEENQVVFARRGKSAREDALNKALARAKENFERKWGRPSNRPTGIRAAYPSESAGLQVVDYYLWALQRLFERGEDRYFALLQSDFRLIMDLDDRRQKPYGEWYSAKNPLTLEKIRPETG